MIKLEEQTLTPIEAEVARIIGLKTKRAGEVVFAGPFAMYDDTELTNAQKVDGVRGLEAKGLVEETPNGAIRRLWGNRFDE